MSGKVALAEIAEVFNGKTPSKAEKRESGYPILKIKDVDDKSQFRGEFESYVDQSFRDKYISKSIQLDDTLILNAAHNADYVGSKQFRVPLEIDGVLATGEWLIVRPTPQFADKPYVNHWLKSDDARFQIRNLVKGIHLYPKDVAGLKIPLPPLAEQKRIAAILDKADAIRRKREQAIKLTDTLLKSVFLDMFGDPVTNPKGWETCKLKEICNKITDGTHQSPKWSSQGIPFIFISNIIDQEITLNTKKFISEEEHSDLTRHSPIEIGDILYTTVGSYGNAALVRNGTKFCFQRHIAHLKPNHELIHSEFLWVMLNTDHIKRQADVQVRGVAQKTLNLSQLKEFIVFCPTSSQQEVFLEKISKMLNLKATKKESLEHSNTLIASLTQRAFRGELAAADEVKIDELNNTV